MPLYGTFKYGEGKYAGGWQIAYDYVSRFRGFRFLIPLSDTAPFIFDKAIDSAANVYARYLIDTAFIQFDPGVDIIEITTPLIDDLQAANKTHFTKIGQDVSADIWFLDGEDFYNGRKLEWNIGLIPFDMSGLLMDTDNYTSKGAGVSIDADAGCPTGNRFTIDVQNEDVEFSMGDSAQPGAYRVFMYATESAADADVTFGIWNETDTAWEGSKASSLGAVYAWDYVDVIIPQADFDAGDDFRLRAIKTDVAGQNVHLAQLATVPISLGDFQGPLNVSHASLNPITIRQQGI